LPCGSATVPLIDDVPDWALTLFAKKTENSIILKNKKTFLLLNFIAPPFLFRYMIAG
jgi:hypothetical protein